MTFWCARCPELDAAFSNSAPGGGAESGRGMWLPCFNCDKYLLNVSAVLISSGRRILFPKKHTRGEERASPRVRQGPVTECGFSHIIGQSLVTWYLGCKEPWEM